MSKTNDKSSDPTKLFNISGLSADSLILIQNAEGERMVGVDEAQTYFEAKADQFYASGSQAHRQMVAQYMTQGFNRATERLKDDSQTARKPEKPFLDKSARPMAQPQQIGGINPVIEGYQQRQLEQQQKMLREAKAQP